MDVYLLANILFGSLGLGGLCVGLLTPKRGPTIVDCLVLAFVLVVAGYLLAFTLAGLVLITAGLGFVAMAFGKSVAEIVVWLRHRTSSQ